MNFKQGTQIEFLLPTELSRMELGTYNYGKHTFLTCEDSDKENAHRF